MSHPELTQNIALAAQSQALITGQLVNQLTGSAIASASLTLALRLPGATEFRPLPARLRLGSAGYFCFSGQAAQVFPQHLPPSETLELRFQASAPNYQDLQLTVPLNASAVTAVTDDQTLGNHTLAVQQIQAPALQQTLALMPTPVALQGLVIEDHDLDTPLAGVSIQVLEPELQAPVLSDAQGRFRIAQLPVAQSVRLQIELNAISTTVDHLVDYTLPLNKRTISLNG